MSIENQKEREENAILAEGVEAAYPLRSVGGCKKVFFSFGLLVFLLRSYFKDTFTIPLAHEDVESSQSMEAVGSEGYIMKLKDGRVYGCAMPAEGVLKTVRVLADCIQPECVLRLMTAVSMLNFARKVPELSGFVPNLKSMVIS